MNKAHEMLVRYIKSHPDETYSSIALMLGTTTPTITRICQQAGLPPRGGKRLTVDAINKLDEKAANSAEVNDAFNG